MISPKRPSAARAMTLPLSILLFWQALGWIAFGFLEPVIAQRAGQPANSGLILIVGLVMAVLTTMLGLFALYYRRATLQGDIVPRPQKDHKCLSCGHNITMDNMVCPYCGAKTFF